MSRILFQVYLLFSISFHIVSAFQFTFPATAGTYINFLERTPITITWETNTPDPATGSILLVNTAVSPPSNLTITNRVELAEKSYTVRREFALGLEGDGKYHFTFVPPGDGSSSVDSYEFTVEGGRGNEPASSSVGVSGSTTEGSPSSTSISTTVPTSASTTAQTNTITTGLPSSTITPNSSGGSSVGSLDRVSGAVLVLVVVACNLN